VALSDVFAKGGEGGVELAKEVVKLVESGKAKFKPLYADKLPLKKKIEKIAKEIYGADGVDYEKKGRKGFGRI
jgi:formate--tetrahydrofolate ligase